MKPTAVSEFLKALEAATPAEIDVIRAKITEEQKMKLVELLMGNRSKPKKKAVRS